MGYTWVNLPIKQIKVVDHTTGAFNARYTTINDSVRNVNLTSYDLVIKFDTTVVPRDTSLIRDFCRFRWDFTDGTSTYDIAIYPVTKNDTMDNAAYTGWTSCKVVDPLMSVSETTGTSDTKLVTTSLHADVNTTVLNNWILAGYDTMVISTTRTTVQGYQWYQATGTTPMDIQAYYVPLTRGTPSTIATTETVIHSETSTIDTTESVQYVEAIDTTELVQVEDISTIDTTELVQIEDKTTIDTTEDIDSPYTGGSDILDTTEYINIPDNSSIDTNEYINIADSSTLDVVELVQIPEVATLDVVETIYIADSNSIETVEVIKIPDSATIDVTEYVQYAETLETTEYINIPGTKTLTVTERVRQSAKVTLPVTETTTPPRISSKATLITTETTKAPTLTAKGWFPVPILQIKTQDRVTGANVVVYDVDDIEDGTIQEQLKTRDIIVTIDKTYADKFLNITDMRVKATLGDVNLSIYPTYIKDVIGSTTTFYPYYASSSVGEAVHKAVRNMTTKGADVSQDTFDSQLGQYYTSQIHLAGLVENQTSAFSIASAISDWFSKKYTTFVLTSYDTTTTEFPDYKDSSIMITDTSQSVKVCDVAPGDRIRLEVYAQKEIPQTHAVQTLTTNELVKYRANLPTTETIARPSGTQTITVDETIAEFSQLATVETIIAYTGEIIFNHDYAEIQVLEQILSPSIDIRQLEVTETVTPAPTAKWHKLPIKQVKVVRCPNYGGGGIPQLTGGIWSGQWNYGNEPVKSVETIYDPSGNQNFLGSGEISDSGVGEGGFITQAWNNPTAQIVPMNDYHVIVKFDREYMDKLTDIQRIQGQIFAYNYSGSITAQNVDDELGDSDYIALGNINEYGELFDQPYAENPPAYTTLEQVYDTNVEVLQEWYEAGHDTIVINSFFSPDNNPQIYASNLNPEQTMSFWVYGIESDTTTAYKNPSSAILEVIETVSTTSSSNSKWIEIPVDQVKFVDWQTGEKTGTTSNARSSSQTEWIDMYTHDAIVKLNNKALSAVSNIQDIKIVATTYNYDGVVTARSVNDEWFSKTVDDRTINVYYDDNNPSEIKYIDNGSFKAKYYCDYKTGAWTYTGDNASLNNSPIVKYSFMQTDGYKQIGSGYNAGELVTVPTPQLAITTSTWYTSRASQRTALGSWFNTKQAWYTDEAYPKSTEVIHDTIMFGSGLKTDGKLYGGDSLKDYQLKVYVLATEKTSTVSRLFVTETVAKTKTNGSVILTVNETIVAPNRETHTLPVSENIILPTFGWDVLSVQERIILPTFDNASLSIVENIQAPSIDTIKVYEMVAKATADNTGLTKAQLKLKRMNEKIAELISDYGSSVKIALVNLYKDDITGIPGGTIIDQIQGDVKAFVTTLTPQYNPFDIWSNQSELQMTSAYECYISSQYYKDLVRWGWANSMSNNYNSSLVLTKGVFVQYRGLWYQVNLPELNSIGDQDMYLKLTMVYSNNTIKYLNTL